MASKKQRTDGHDIVRESTDFFNPEHLAYLSTYAGSFQEADRECKALRKMQAQSRLDKDGIGRCPVSYHTESYRLFADGPCLQRTHHKVRNALMPTGAVDLDFKNCMPEIFRNLCINYKIECPALTFFCSNTDKCLAEIGGNKRTKIILFTGNGHIDQNNMPTWAKRLIYEVNNVIAPELAKKEPGIWVEAKEANEQKRVEKEGARLKKDRVYIENTHGIFMSRIYFKHETIVTAALFENGRRLGLWDGDVVFMFDGLCVLPSKDIGCDTLRDLEIAVEQDTTMKLRLTTKPLEPRLDINTAKVPEMLSVVNKHEEASDIFLAAVGNNMLRCGNQIWVKHRGVWSDDLAIVDVALVPKCTAMNIRLMRTTKDGDIVHDPFSVDLKHAKQIVTLAKLKARDDHLFAKRLILESHLKVAFRDGYLEFRPMDESGVYWVFHHGKEFDTKVRVESDFPDRIQADIDFVYDKILRPPFDNSPDKDVLKRFLTALARALAGHLDKMSYMVTGFRDSAKSAIMQFVQNALHKYVCRVPSEVLAIGKSGGDAYRQGAWAFDMEDARITVMSESKSDKEGVVVYSGEDLKKMQSMKEGVRARKLNQEQRDVYSISTLFFMCNDIPTFNPADALQKCAIFNLPNKFKDKAEVDRNKFSSIYKIADERIETWIREPRYTNALIHIILDHYSPNKVEQTEDMIEQVEQMMQETGEDLYDRLFEITMDPDDVIEQSKVLKILKENKADAGHNKFTRDMEEIIKTRAKAGQIKPFKFATRDKVGTVPRRKLYCGIKIRKTEEETGFVYPNY